MPDKPHDARGVAVPSGRLARLARFGGLAGGVAGNVAVDAARRFAAGERPSMADLLLTPANAMRVTRQLADLRGAAMKIGQLLSMDAGEVLPPELTEILARLRADARRMPASQLQKVLTERWGQGWRDRFAVFEPEPMAAASIGQVHRAMTRDGRDLAVKIQYPGVRRSIDSDVGNVATLLRLSGLLPPTLDVAPMLAEAKRQLHEEADYAREGRHLARFGELLADAPGYVVPRLHADLTTADVLAMSFVEGEPVERMVDAPQDERDWVATLLLELTLRELFEFRLMQTDPNFANYRYDRTTRRLALLDFGATRALSPQTTGRYRALLRAAMAGDREAVRRGAVEIGFFDASTDARHQDAALDLAEIVLAPLRAGGVYDFAEPGRTARLREGGLALAGERDFWRIPPMDTLFIQRKAAGMYLLAQRLRARVDVRALLARWL
ncbi:ABC1 kinase family protein [Rubrimonas cliftonensis]|uniref:Predicted unusual protein kinase regulating ubiquinone biosynthesis, AarF/ABC1/UbiB family n=1 Tax=Rubrimonas cliftonensis TaxID=89524 RepID=A0A1H4CCV3_9RHOB|nr:AarF/ABC1/UbiB kinase family protein [Rubrimonas cliftonensis]SEA58231.1 Predicted unusual protein kinase regulating ubiquinone biosynthesis, AarF/ABC1/UbiB family [Rubrimonas cliftonensis]